MSPLATVKPLFPSGLALLWCLLLLGQPPAGRAGDEAAYSRPGVLHLSLEGAIQMALRRNYSIMVQRFEPQIRQQDVARAGGQFDPVLNLGASRLESSRRSFLDGRFSPTRSISRQDSLFDLNVSGNTPVGTSYVLGLGETNNTGNSLDYLGNYTSTGGLGLTQPLLRGFGFDSNLYQIRLAKNNVLISEWQLRRQLIDTLTRLVYVYNDLHTAQENLQVAIRSRDLARQLLEDNMHRVEIGVMSPPDVITARADAAAREEGVILANRNQLDNENLLKQLVTNDLEPMLSVRVEIDRPPSPEIRVEVRSGIQDALQFLPEYRQAILDIQAQNITVKFARNQVLPRLDLTGSLNLLGLENDFATSLGRIGERDSTEWRAGFTFSYPLGNHVAKADLQQARLASARALLNLQALEQNLIVQVDNAGGQIVSNRARIVSTSEASRLAQESLTAGEQRLRAGTSTTFVVLELQKRLAEAEYAAIQARADYNKSIAEYYRQTGTTLQVFHIAIN